MGRLTIMSALASLELDCVSSLWLLFMMEDVSEIKQVVMIVGEYCDD